MKEYYKNRKTIRELIENRAPSPIMKRRIICYEKIEHLYINDS